MNETLKMASCCMPTPVHHPNHIEILEVAQNRAPASHEGMKSLAGGAFLMGTDSGEAWPQDGEGPVREIVLAPFWMDECAVTNAQFARFVEETGYGTEAENFGWSYVFHRHVTPDNKKTARGASGDALWWLGIDGAFWKRPEGPGSSIKTRMEHPVVHVSWNDALNYANWAGKSLPTEAQWEYGARGGLEQKIYPWGNDLTPKNKRGQAVHRCNIWQGKFPDLDTGADGWKGTAPAKTYEPNGFGLYQMSGNTWEWCADWFSRDFHSAGPRENPSGPAGGETKIIKGGSFLCHASYCNRYRVAARTSNTTDAASSHCGFRCVVNS